MLLKVQFISLNTSPDISCFFFRITPSQNPILSNSDTGTTMDCCPQVPVALANEIVEIPAGRTTTIPNRNGAVEAANSSSVDNSSTKDSTDEWDPFGLRTSYNEMSLARIKADLESIRCDPPPGIVVVPNEEDFGSIDALIIGPSNTPYEGAFFHFLLRFPDKYPYEPLKVRLFTTGNGTIISSLKTRGVLKPGRL